ncbi:hypothetical protein [Sphingomonas sp. PR090111-T3T-6A]|uniref:hypothetical protein n=1 Tax=Sphingomonas sp. PR090111-T3T-6A TaxID=685778 RepID=UPI000377D09A|nr:hypothetical protein [Sphingomonas sp. PR090111-T3T-6A]
MTAMTEQDIAADANKTSLTLRVNGQPFAVCTSEAGIHAESYACNFLLAALGNQDRGASALLAEAEQGSRPGGLPDKGCYDIFLTRSPCGACTDRILQVHNLLPENRTLRLFCATVYRGTRNAESRANIVRLKGHGVPVLFWDAARMALAGDIDSATLLRVAHHLSLWDSREADGGRADHKLGSRMASPDLGLLPLDTNSIYYAK